MKKILTVIVLQTCLLTGLYAQPSNWKMVPERSSLTFIATQNGAPVKGEFKKFSGDFIFDLNQLKDSKVKVTVDMSSVASSYAELTGTLKTSDWFNMAVFPQAVFESSEFTKTGDNQYQAKGTVTIRGKSEPVVLTFTASQPTENAALVTGYTTLKRTAFGVGQGEWASTNEIKDEVRIDFVVSATK